MTDDDAALRAWAGYDATLDRVLHLNARLLQAAALDRAKPAFRRMERGQWAAAGIWATILLGLGSFAADHRGEAALCLSAALAAIYTIWMLNAALRQAIIVHSMDFAAPVAQLLDQAAALRARRVNQTRIGVLAGTVVWAPFFIVFCKAFLGVGVTSVPWLVANIIFGLALACAAYWAARRFACRMVGWPAVQRLMDDIAGRNLSEATRFLAELAAFQTEPAS